MKQTFRILAILLFMAFVLGNVWAEEDFTTLTGPELKLEVPKAEHYMSFNTETGELTIDGKPLDRLSDPEIKEAIKSIAKSMQRNNLIDYYDKQTEYLLKELEKCRQGH